MLTTSEFSSALRDRVNASDLPAAVVFNSHITGLAVARSLGRRGAPIIALDRDAAGYALASKYVTAAGLCPNVLEDEAGFIDFLVTLGRELARPAVLFPCNDEWVLAVNRHRATLEEYFLIPFSGPEVVEPVLDKARLYQRATELGIPIPRTWYLHPNTIEQVVAELPYPCIVKPTEQRAFYDAFQDKAWRIGGPAELFAAIERAQEHPMVAQEIVGQGLTDFYSVCSYIGKAGDETGGQDVATGRDGHGRDAVFVGRKLEQYPPQFGTGCLVAAEWVESIAERGIQILKTFGYHGVSEVEFIYDERDDEYKLLDINTRVWKWIGLPIAAGVDLPWLAYSDAVGRPVSSEHPRDGIIWTYAKDYMALRQGGLGKGTAHYVPEAAWAELIAGRTEHIVDAVIDPNDPGPAARMLHNTLNPRPYFCAC